MVSGRREQDGTGGAGAKGGGSGEPGAPSLGGAGAVAAPEPQLGGIQGRNSDTEEAQRGA